MPPNRRSSDSRNQLIGAVKTPIGFFTLSLLIAEAVFGIGYAASASEHKVLMAGGMLGVLTMLVIIVALFAWFRPGVLVGDRPTRSIRDWRQKLRTGDHVRIITPPATVVTPDGTIDWTREMARFCGLTAQVVEIESEPVSYRLDIDAQLYSWAPNWLEPVE